MGKDESLWKRIRKYICKASIQELKGPMNG